MNENFYGKMDLIQKRQGVEICKRGATLFKAEFGKILPQYF